MAYTKSITDVMYDITQRIYPSHTRPLPIKTREEEGVPPTARLILEEAINDLNDWIAKGGLPKNCFNGRRVDGINREFAGIFLNKLKTAFRYNNGEGLFPELDLKNLSTNDIHAKFDFSTHTYTLSISHSNYTRKDDFLIIMKKCLKEVGDPNKCRGHLLKFFQPFYNAISNL